MDLAESYLGNTKELDFEFLSSAIPSQEQLLGFSGKVQTILDAIEENKKKPRWDKHVYTDTIKENGKVIQESMETYLANRGYLSSSILSSASKSPLHFAYEWEYDYKRKLEELKGESDAFTFGTLLHTCLLEPTAFDRIVTTPKIPQNSTKGRQEMIDWWENKIKEADPENAEALINECRKGIDISAFKSMPEYISKLQDASGLEAVTEDKKIILDAVKFNYMRYGDGILPEILKYSKREISMYWDDPVSQLKQKIRPDSLQFEEAVGLNMIISVKTTRAENLDQYAYEYAKHNYPMKEAMYQKVASEITGRDFNTTLMIVAQNQAPYGVMAFILDSADMQAGMERYDYALQIVKHSIEKKLLAKGYDFFAEEGDRGLMLLSTPDWYKRKELQSFNVND